VAYLWGTNILQVMPSGDLLATILGALSFHLIHESTGAMTSLTSITVLLTTYFNISLFQHVINFLQNLTTQPGTNNHAVGYTKTKLACIQQVSFFSVPMGHF
jgi:hypothetical protein